MANPNLNMILNWTMKNTVTEEFDTSNYKPLSKDDQAFIMNAMDDFMINIVDVMKKCLEVLKSEAKGEAGSEEAADHLSARCAALEAIADHCENVDAAKDFCTIGGVHVVVPLLTDAEPSVRALSAGVFAALTQNHPHCQEKALEGGVLPILMKLMADSEGSVRTRAMGALSGLLRNNAAGLAAFLEEDGIACQLAALSTDNASLKKKVIFFLLYLARAEDQPAAPKKICTPETASTLATLIGDQDVDLREQTLALLTALNEANPSFKEMCCSPAGSDSVKQVATARKEELSSLLGNKNDVRLTVDIECVEEELRLCNELLSALA